MNKELNSQIKEIKTQSKELKTQSTMVSTVDPQHLLTTFVTLVLFKILGFVKQVRFSADM